MIRDWYPVIITFLFTALSVVFKLLSRRDKDPAPFYHDLYVAQSLSMGSVSALAVYLIKSILAANPANALSCAILLLSYILFTGVLACLDRWTAWKVDARDATKFKRKTVLGLIVPDFAAIIGYFVVFFFAKNQNL